MKAGRLRHRVMLEKPERVRDALGQPVIKWLLVAPLWAEINAVSGRELLSAGAEQGELTVRIWLRYRDDIKEDWRVIHDGIVYTLGAPPIPDAKKTRLELLCNSGVAYA